MHTLIPHYSTTDIYIYIYTLVGTFVVVVVLARVVGYIFVRVRCVLEHLYARVLWVWLCMY